VLNRGYFFAALIVFGAVIYVSLYPFVWRSVLPPWGPLTELMRSFGHWPESHGDFLANTILYLPLGFCAALAVAQPSSMWPRLIIATILGAALSFAIELSQFYVAERFTDIRDLYANALGSCLGAFAGLALGGNLRAPLLRDLQLQPFPAMLLFAFLAVRLYPYVPVIDMHKYIQALRPLLAIGALAKGDLYARSVSWLVLAYLLETLFGRRSSVLAYMFLAVFFFAAETLIIGRSVSLADVLGALIALVLWFFALRFTPGRLSMLALLFASVVMLERLEPFRLNPIAHGYDWIPFAGMMRGSVENGVLIILQKLFLYGGLIWLLNQAGLRLWRATVATMVLVLFCSIIQMYIPGRSAGITDAMIALLIGLVMRPMTARPKPKQPRGRAPQPA
jgi:VanZ family protein